MNDRQVKFMMKKISDGFHDVVLALDNLKTELQKHRALQYKVYKKQGLVE